MAVQVWSIWASCWSRKYPQSFHLVTVNVMMMMVMMTMMMVMMTMMMIILSVQTDVLCKHTYDGDDDIYMMIIFRVAHMIR